MVIQSCTPWNKIHFVFLTLIPSLKPVNHTDVNVYAIQASIHSQAMKTDIHFGYGVRQFGDD